ncbi:hypothetical protein WA158_004598 [Blastocystis sp. Blastoise]
MTDDYIGWSAEELYEEYDSVNKTFQSMFPNDKDYKDTIAKLKTLLYKLSDKIRRERLFSDNEDISEIDTEDFKYLMVGYYMGDIMQKGMDNRLNNLKSGLVYLDSFLHVLDSYKILKPADSEAYHFLLEHEKEPQGLALRDLKITRMKNDKEATTRLNEIKQIQEKKQKGGIVDEDLEREKYLLMLQSCSRKALDNIHMINEEIPLLIIRQQLEKGEIKKEVVMPAPLPSKGLEITHIGTDLSITKETIKAGVFKPWWELPSVSMDTYAEQEIHHMKEDEEARKNNPGPDKKYKQLEEEGLEDDEELVDKATIRERNWDDWQDNHAKGIGNTKRI